MIMGTSKTEKPAEVFDLAFECSDMGNASRLAHRFGHGLRYSYERQKWIFWNGKHWQWDSGRYISFIAKTTADGILQEAADCPDTDRKVELAKHAIKSQDVNRIKAMITLAQSELTVKLDINQLDTDPFLLNCNNGTLNLKTEELQPHNAKDYITRMIDIDYEPEATAPSFRLFLKRIFDNSTELIEYVQMTLGYSITGSQDEIAFFFCHGAGWNGKGTLLGIMRDVLGPYAYEVDPTAFMVNKNKGAGPDEAIANLYDKRFVTSTELTDGQRLSVGLIKRMTGGEELRHEKKYEHGFNFRPTHKLWLCGNHEPRIADTTSSIWGRLKKIPFKTEIPEDERISGLRQQLVQSEAPGIFAWLVAGCFKWQNNCKLIDPPEVKRAVADYRERQDVLNEFYNECCVKETGVRVVAAELYRGYTEWCKENSMEPIGNRRFNEQLRERGFITERGAENKLTWMGLRLRRDGEKLL